MCDVMEIVCAHVFYWARARRLWWTRVRLKNSVVLVELVCWYCWSCVPSVIISINKYYSFYLCHGIGCGRWEVPSIPRTRPWDAWNGLCGLWDPGETHLCDNMDKFYEIFTPCKVLNLTRKHCTVYICSLIMTVWCLLWVRLFANNTKRRAVSVR